jgi:hypothetical protein
MRTLIVLGFASVLSLSLLASSAHAGEAEVAAT